LNNDQTDLYSIPNRFRRMENLHILFWLIKDLCWCLAFKPLGMVMIIPTLAIAVFITWRTRTVKSELAHNLAIIFWITANSTWMTAEFFGFDAQPVLFGLNGKYLALIPFIIGLLILAWYYIIIRPKESKKNQLVPMQTEQTARHTALQEIH
jgi:hypothetical protein